MILVKIKRYDDNNIYSFAVQGHANYNPGDDIVCAAVSAITIGTVNALGALAKVELPNIDYQSGLLKVRIDADADHHDRAQTILESMIIMLRSVEQSYGKHLKIKDRGGSDYNAN